jgi:hypothetical protein
MSGQKKNTRRHSNVKQPHNYKTMLFLLKALFTPYFYDLHYGRRKGQKLAVKGKQTYNVISVNKKPNKLHYLLDQWTFYMKS